MRHFFYYLFLSICWCVVWTLTGLHLLRMALFRPQAIPHFWVMYDARVPPAMAKFKQELWQIINE